jgi:hypothetical protein
MLVQCIGDWDLGVEELLLILDRQRLVLSLATIKTTSSAKSNMCECWYGVTFFLPLLVIVAIEISNLRA